jgi:hypothetical protein
MYHTLSQIQQTVALRTAALYYMYFSKIYWVMTAMLLDETVALQKDCLKGIVSRYE